MCGQERHPIQIEREKTNMFAKSLSNRFQKSESRIICRSPMDTNGIVADSTQSTNVSWAEDSLGTQQALPIDWREHFVSLPFFFFFFSSFEYNQPLVALGDCARERLSPQRAASSGRRRRRRCFRNILSDHAHLHPKRMHFNNSRTSIRGEAPHDKRRSATECRSNERRSSSRAMLWRIAFS